MAGNRTFGPGYNFPGFSEPSSKPILVWDPNNPASFLELIDTFNHYDGLAGRAIIVNQDENGLTTAAIDFVSDKYYVHLQASPATTWMITHPLAKRASVTITDEQGHVMTTDIQYLSDSYIEVNFVNAKAGVAYLN